MFIPSAKERYNCFCYWLKFITDRLPGSQQVADEVQSFLETCAGEKQDDYSVSGCDLGLAQQSTTLHHVYAV